MGSRGRSIRLRIYFLVAIPLITMLGLFSYVAYTSVTNFQNLDRAPSLIKATSEPMTAFVSLLQAERRAAVVYLSDPGAASLSAYNAAITKTKAGELTLEAAIDSAGTQSSTNAQESAAIITMITAVNGMTGLRTQVANGELTPLTALTAYTKIISDQSAVYQAEAGSMTETVASSQGLGLIATVNTREDLDEQDAVLAGALASGALSPADRVAFDQAAGRQEDDTLLYSALLTPAELTAFNATLNRLAPPAVQADLATVQRAVEGGATLRQLGLSAASWQQLTSAVANANYQAGTVAANVDLGNVQQLASDAKKRVWETGAIGLAGLILTLLVTILLARSINRRLTRLRRSALTLAEEQLPSVVARLRRGETVDVAAEAPPLNAGADEIGQVGQAIDTVRQTAIRSAVEEARLRAGLNDVFRNLARRNQSLLQRQLSVLDDMERRATDPDVLADLFTMDHLTTRMRRHAEGLIILSGAAPGRGWSAPVKLIDVMRGAVAEVEDYARVTVSTQSTAALSGAAVTDVIHLLAELIENATTLSPPFTQVRVAGESVGNGFAIEIEDRGLGLAPQRMAELNERLANPPDINPANTEQLGLFVVGQLARRHSISVALRPSPYGGTTAVMVIPQRLIVDEAPTAITAGGPGGPSRAAAWQTGVDGGTHDGGYDDGYDDGYGAAFGGLDGAVRGSQPNGPAGTRGPAWSGVWAGPADNGYGPADNRYGPADNGYGAADDGYGGPADDGSVYPEMPFAGFASPASGGSVLPPPKLDSPYTGRPDRGAYGGTRTGGGAAAPGSGPRVSGALRQTVANEAVDDAAANGGAGGGAYGGAANAGAGGADSGAGGSSGARRGRHIAADVPVVTGVPVSRPTGSSFDVFTPLDRTTEQAAVPPADPGDAPYAASYTDYGGGPYGTTGYGDPPYGQTAAYGQTAYGETAYGGTGHGGNADDGGYSPGNPDGRGSGDYKGLPRRVRQANLAPQLRSSAAANSNGSTGVPRATAASLSDMRNTLSAMQRGWQEGRAESRPDTEGRVDGD